MIFQKTLIGLFSITLLVSCSDSGDDPESSTSTETSDSQAAATTPSSAASTDIDGSEGEAALDQIEARIDEDRKCLEKDVDLEENDFGEFEWRYCKTDSFEFVSRDGLTEAGDQQEIYALENGELVYASEQLIDENSDTYSVRYAIVGDEVVDHESLGRGPADGDDWKPESIFDLWDARKANFETLQNQAAETQE